MKNLTHVMKNMNVTDNMKAYIFYLGKNFTSSSVRWLRRGSEHIISHQKMEDK